MNRPTQNEIFEGGANEVDLRQILSHLLEKKWLLAGCIIFFLLVGFTYLKFTPPVYEATTLVEVQYSRNVAKFEDYQDQNFGSDEIVKTLEHLFQRDSLYRRVMKNPEIQKNPELQQSLGGSDQSMGLQEQGELLKEWTKVRLEKGTRLIAVSVQHTKPLVAQKLATTIVDEFLSEKEDLRSRSWTLALEELAGEEDRAGKKLTESQGTLQGLEALTGIQEKIEKQKDEIANLRKSYQEEHPEVRKAQGLMAKLYNDLEGKIGKIGPHLLEENARKVGGENFSREELLDAEYERLIPYHPEISVQVEKDRAVFDSILRSRREIDVTMRLAATPIEIVEEAFEPREPVKPRKLQVLAASIFLGGGLGLVLMWGIHVVNLSLRTVDSAERIVGLPVLGVIFEDSHLPDFSRLKKRNLDDLKKQFAHTLDASDVVLKQGARGTGEPLVLASNPGGPIAEAFRSLRAALLLTGKLDQQAQKIFLVTSAVPGEGKSLVAANLALALACQGGGRTLLIDANLRRPIVDALFDLEQDSGGLVETLTGESDSGGQIIKSGFADLDLLPAGINARNPAELLSGSAMQQLLQNLSEQYDRIVIDSAPVNTVSDALLLAPHVHSAILVARAGDTPQEAVIRACELLGRVGRKPAGMVLNRLPAKAGMTTNPCLYHCVAQGGYGKNYG